MAPQQGLKKRKGPQAEPESDDELNQVALEGVLSEGEDDSDFEGSEGSDSDNDSAEFDGLEGSDVEEDEDEDDGFLSEDIPSDGEDARKDGKISAADDEDEGPSYRIVTDANGGVRYEYDEIDPVYDSDDSDAQGPANTIGDIPLSFYDSYPHIGYDINGKKIMRPATGEALDALLDSIEIPKGWTGLTDPETGKPLNLTQDQLELLRKIQMNEVPEDGYDPYPDTIEYFTSIEEKMPLSAAPEPKRRFVPSKHEAKRVAKLVRAIKEGRILPYKPEEEREREEEEKEETYYDIWANEEPQPFNVMNIPAPKLPPPGYDLSYNPPPEYLPTQAEKEEWLKQDPEEREKGERFNRCLDLYLAPRMRKNRLNIDPASLLPKLPPPGGVAPLPHGVPDHPCRSSTARSSADLMENPTIVPVKMLKGHKVVAKLGVMDVDWHPTEPWCVSAGADGTCMLWT
ncbi:eukaryotic ribosome biogenesis protein [Verticillium alfalfae VaMs.102]|uniref:Eukaryotic ribosome biogenesis protein n=1 Tax=Verticillium alfalfae (strain VaMs.102 / ATCC MYA-4576 / FGSC 10136) TaxID=526221 RepID=C9SHN6_VERA1|nr:eukaryotic ribosome biogenesis protein [Verticillium alfalfae VaMs.102]EEY18459.1 eukaryotic ribosome biogenesis protein [Verticillium alfalfae VaMs.102]